MGGRIDVSKAILIEIDRAIASVEDLYAMIPKDETDQRRQRAYTRLTLKSLMDARDLVAEYIGRDGR